MRSDEDRILDISEAIAAISKRVRSRKDFDDDELLRVWCLHHIVVIGEAASRVLEALKERYPEVPWRRVVAMRNAVVHGYFQHGRNWCRSMNIDVSSVVISITSV